VPTGAVDKMVTSKIFEPPRVSRRLQSLRGWSRENHKKVRERAVRMVFDHREEYNSEWVTMRSVASKFGMTRGGA